MAKNLIGGNTTTINENGDDISVELNSTYADFIGIDETLNTTAQTLPSAINEVNKVNEINDASILFDTSNYITFSPSGCSNYANYGNCYYYKIGNRVHIHIGVSGLTANTTANVITMPEGYRPNVNACGLGIGNSTSQFAVVQVIANGQVGVRSQGTYACIDIEYEAVQ